METMKEIVLQEMNEKRFNRKHIDAKIRASIENNPFMVNKLNEGIDLINQYLQGSYHQSKQERIEQVKLLDIPALVMDLYVGIAYVLREELFTSVTAQLASRLGFDDKEAAITTVAELVAVLCETDVFDINKRDRQSSLMLVSRIPLEDTLLHFIENSAYLPPMVCEPLELTHNFSSGYLTHNDSLILGKGNHHNGDICLDVLNTMNQIPLKLDTEFLSKLEEEPTFEITTQETLDNWKKFKEESYYLYALMQQQGNKFYFNHKVDKRGRIYCQGYHLSTQGTAFKKAMLEFYEEEFVDGVPGN